MKLSLFHREGQLFQKNKLLVMGLYFRSSAAQFQAGAKSEFGWANSSLVQIDERFIAACCCILMAIKEEDTLFLANPGLQ